MQFVELRRADRLGAALAALATIVILVIYSRFRPAMYDNFVWEANGWLRGFAYLPHFPGDYMDAMPFHGRAYVYEAPLPAVLLLPLVAIWGLDTNQTVLAIALSAIGAAAAWQIARRVGLSLRWTALLVAFLLFGTSDAYCGATGDVWVIAHSGAVAFTLLAIDECMGTRRPSAVTLWALAAAFCRYPMFLAAPAYLIVLWPQLTREPQKLLRVAAVVAVFAIPAAWYNEVRYGTVVDIGFTIFYRVMDIRRHGPGPPFALANLPMQLQFFFVQPPRIVPQPPYLVAGLFGTALTYTSPALAIGLLAPLRERTVQLLWLATALCALPSLLYYSTGIVQLGARHALDVIPFVFLLMAIAIRARPHWFYVPFLAWSIAFGIVELWVWQFDANLVH